MTWIPTSHVVWGMFTAEPWRPLHKPRGLQTASVHPSRPPPCPEGRRNWSTQWLRSGMQVWVSLWRPACFSVGQTKRPFSFRDAMAFEVAYRGYLHALPWVLTPFGDFGVTLFLPRLVFAILPPVYVVRLLFSVHLPSAGLLVDLAGTTTRGKSDGASPGRE